MRARVLWIEDQRFLCAAESGHHVLVDGRQEGAPTPMEMVLMAAGSCSAVDVVSILAKARQEVTRCEVELRAERADSAPRVFTKIHLHFVVTGPRVEEKPVARAVQLSAEKYCSVARMLERSVEITHSFAVKTPSASPPG